MDGDRDNDAPGNHLDEGLADLEAPEQDQKDNPHMDRYA
jgi:hypothetical protein